MEYLESQIISEIEKLSLLISSHGGSIKFVKFENFLVYIKLIGNCKDCPMQFYTVSNLIEKRLKEKISTDLSVSIV